MDQSYRLLASDEDKEERERVSLDDIDNFQLRPRKFGLHYEVFPCMRFLAIPLLLMTGFLVGHWARGAVSITSSSPYADLSFSQRDTLWWNTEYSNENATISELNELWDTHIPWESGIIAMDKDEARNLGLPDSQPFPWDAGQKSIYIVNAHHILHCVRNLYISIQQYRTNTPQTVNYPHILHCLDSLRTETMCSADDTLRYVPLNSAHGFRPGDGQDRKCRDWNKLQRFVDAHDSCYHYLMPGNNEISNLERFKFCPADSQYLPKIRRHMTIVVSDHQDRPVCA
ncbi:hypothetical protein BJ166DRAFT_492666 [Pestalotiopsis sp. NC0098]|nr:hypothetical protein BJ166DRAFT_492666 [Pestalotiopsis sp. NC0098]